MNKDSDDYERIRRYTLVALWIFTALCLAVVCFSILHVGAWLLIAAYIFDGFRTIRPVQLPFLLVVLSLVLYPGILAVTTIAAWSQFEREKFRAVRLTIAVVLLWPVIIGTLFLLVNGWFVTFS